MGSSDGGTATAAGGGRRGAALCPGEMVYGGGTECAGLILPTEGQLRAYMLTDEGRELTLYRLFPRDMCLFPPPAYCGASSSTCWWRRSGIPRPFFC
ncbi:MAG: hypothetical protein ACLRNQ_06045 [Flavonifractor plautii]